ncbi:MAG: hypothetical protein QOF89_6093 [Acidobacteriota bacterium]|jgi:hypothetical protein|nr:hypothetical protein [Acidobacteriota bacterium]
MSKAKVSSVSALPRAVTLALLAFFAATNLLKADECEHDSKYVIEHPPRKWALVIGNADYHELTRIPSSATDAEKMRELLASLDFSVTPGVVTSRRQLEDDYLVPFRSQIQRGDLVVVYFSGHGFSHGPFNYLAPTLLPKKLQAKDLTQSAVSVEALEDFFACRPGQLGCISPGLLVMILDACRSVTSVEVTDPDGTSTVGKGSMADPLLANETNVLIAFAARPGHSAEGSTVAGQLSTFTKNLVPFLAVEGLEIGSVFKEAFTDVIAETEGAQNPGLVDWNKSVAFLKPSQAELEGERTAWCAALDTQDPKQVGRYVRRNALSRYAFAAREWLADNPQTPLAPGFTLASPAAIDRAWRGNDDMARVAVRRAELPLAFPRQVDSALWDRVSLPSGTDMSDTMLGLVPSGTSATDLRGGKTRATQRPAFDAVVFQAHGSAVLLRDSRAFVDATSPSAATRQLAFGTALEVRSIEKRANNIYWLEGQVAGTHETLFVPLSPQAPPEPLELGHSLREILVPPQGGTLPDVVEPGPLTAALKELGAAGKKVSWVSLASSESDDEEARDALEGRLTHVRYVLTRSGVDGRRVTAVTRATDVPSGWIRIRIFGY